MDFKMRKLSSHTTELPSSKKIDPKKMEYNNKTETVEEGLVFVATLLTPADPVNENGEALFDAIFSSGIGSHPVAVPLTSAELELARRGEYTIHDFSTLDLDRDFPAPREGEKDFKFAGYIPGRFYDAVPDPNSALPTASRTNLATENEGMEFLPEEEQDASKSSVGSWVGEASDTGYTTDEDEIADSTTNLQVGESSFKPESLFAVEEDLMLNWKNGTRKMMSSDDFGSQSVQFNYPTTPFSEGTPGHNRKFILFSDLVFPPSPKVAPGQKRRGDDDFINGTESHTETTQDSTSASDSKSSEENKISQPTLKISLLTSGSQSTNVKVDDRKAFEAGVVSVNIQKLKRSKPGRCVPPKLPFASAVPSTATPSRKSLRQHKAPVLYGFEWMSQAEKKFKPKSTLKSTGAGSRTCTKRNLEGADNGTENQHGAVHPEGIRKKSKKRATW